MKKYGDIIERMMEIIRLSEKKKSELDANDLKNNFNDHFAHIQHCDIAVEYASEFRDLIDAERTFMLLKIDSPLTCLDKTRDLLAICKDNKDPGNSNYFNYEELAQIITSSYGKSAFDLTEYKGYYILRDKINRFLWLMRKLNLFPDEIQMTEKERMDEVNNQLFTNKQQYNRLQSYFDQAKSVKNNEVKGEIIPFDTAANLKPNFKNKEHGDLILLGLNGDLSIDIVEKLRIAYSDQQYQKLLDELQEWHIFSEEEIEKLRHIEDKDIMLTDEMDQLFAFFVTKKITDANALRLLVPAIGKENCLSLIENLFKAGSISLEAYEEFLNLELGVEAKVIKKA